MTHIDERRLSHFLAAIETGSILGAAEHVHLSQPALSRSIRELEQSIGVELLERHPRGVRPTVYGEVLARHARLLQNQSRLAISEIGALRDGHAGHLCIGIAPSFQRLLPAAMASLLETRPGLTFRVVEGMFDTVAEGVLAGDLDAAFTMFPTGERTDGLVLRPLMQSELVLVMGARHALARRRALPLARLADLPWVMICRPPSLVSRLREAFVADGVAPPPQCVETDSVVFAKELLRSDRLIGVLPRELVQAEVSAGQLVARRFTKRADSQTAGVITRSDAVLPAAVELLIAAVEQERERMRLPGPG